MRLISGMSHSAAAGRGSGETAPGRRVVLSWRDEIDIALREWIATVGGDQGGGDQGGGDQGGRDQGGRERGGERWERIARARRDGAPGHFAADIRSANLSP